MNLGSLRRFGSLAETGLRQLLPIAVCVSVAATGCASGGATASNNTAHPVASPTLASNTPTDTLGATVTPSAPASGSTAARLLVLADGVEGGVGLWTCTGGDWAATEPISGATALARDGQALTFAIGGSLASRAVSSPGVAGTALSPKWVKEPLIGSIVGLDRSDSGATAIVVSASDSLTFAVVAKDGTASELSPAPSSPFGPSVAWLDSDRLALISVDAEQIPRLAVVDSVKQTIELLSGLGGVRVFALSPDRQTLAAATESAVYVASAGDWLANKVPAPIANLKPSQVVWDPALSADGSLLAILSGTEDADGIVTEIHEIGYVRDGSSWAVAFDSAAPFGRALGQVWLD
jgi:hypothetical protein